MKKLVILTIGIIVTQAFASASIAGTCQVREEKKGTTLLLSDNFGSGVMKASVGTATGPKSFQSGVIQCDGGQKTFRELRRNSNSILLEVQNHNRMRRLDCRVDVSMNWNTNSFYCRQ